MINLLPPSEKEKLFLEKKKRMVIILWFLALFFVVCLIFILFSVKIYLQDQLKIQKTLLSQSQKEAGMIEIKDFKERVNLINEKLAALNSFYRKKLYFSEVLENVSFTLPQGLYLTNLFFEKSKQSEVAVFLSGFSPTRELLFDFKQKLEEEPDFKEVSFPPANWVKSKNINFIVSFKICK